MLFFSEDHTYCKSSMMRRIEDTPLPHVSGTKHYWEIYNTQNLRMKRLFTGKPLFIKIEAIIVVPIIISDGEWAAVSPQEAIPRASPLTQPVGSEGGQYPASDSIINSVRCFTSVTSISALWNFRFYICNFNLHNCLLSLPKSSPLQRWSKVSLPRLICQHLKVTSLVC